MTKLFTKASLCMILNMIEEQVNGGKAILNSIMDSVLLNPSPKKVTAIKRDIWVFHNKWYLIKVMTLKASSLLSMRSKFHPSLFFSFYLSIFLIQHDFRLPRPYARSVPNWLGSIYCFVASSQRSLALLLK